MRIFLLILLFTFINNEAFAGKKITKKCNGFCENENYEFSIYGGPQKSIRIINGKKKKHPQWTIYRGLNVKDTKNIMSAVSVGC